MVKSGETTEEDKKERKYLRREFNEMQFKQAFTLPENIKREQIAAKVENGILTIDLPKITEDERLHFNRNYCLPSNFQPRRGCILFLQW